MTCVHFQVLFTAFALLSVCCAKTNSSVKLLEMRQQETERLTSQLHKLLNESLRMNQILKEQVTSLTKQATSLREEVNSLQVWNQK